MRLCVFVMTLGFLLVAIAAGMWPSWALAASLSPPAITVVAVSSPVTTKPPAFKPCYHAVRASNISCFPQIGLPGSATGGETRNSGHCVPVTGVPATKLIFRETEPRPPRPSFIA